ncbi:MAG: oligo,6-glucosidase, partial [Nocardioidaceae bacterium]|nr:oligo,6-glucosidase [Nocardioidaceae bacterium]
RDPEPGTQGGAPGAEPNNWGSFFSGSAWEWVPEREQYYLHLFSRKQPDLNWDNAEVREAVFAMMRWWLDRGVAGFRMDVINLISKDPAFPDGKLREDGLGDGTPYFSSGPRIHDFLAQMKREVFDPHQEAVLTVGEMPGVTAAAALQFTDEETGQLGMVFQFEHVGLDHGPSKWDERPMTLVDLKRSLGNWQVELGRGWNSLYLSNHDQPRSVSRFGNDTTYWRESATALATMLHLHRGTPYVYQGEELGMTNVPFDSIDDFRDIESLNHYRDAVARGQDPEKVLASLRRMSRDNARTPMQWTAGPEAGFTTGRPWIEVNPNHTWLNADAQRGDPGSVCAYYRSLVALRHSEPAVVDGDFDMLLPDDPAVYAFRRRLGDRCVTVHANLSDNEVLLALPDDELVLSNLLTPPQPGRLRPWEACVHRSVGT